MKKILIVQSVPGWIRVLSEAISKEVPNLIEDITYTDSFNHALEIAPRSGKLLVITSNMFHDNYSEHKNIVPEKIIDDFDKDGNQLAKLIKKINPEAQVFLFSEFMSADREFLDGYISKTQYTPENIKAVLNTILKK